MSSFGGCFDPWFIFLDFQRVFFLTVASSTDLFGGYVQEGMFAGFGGWRKRIEGKMILAIHGTLDRREVKLPLVF